MVLYAANGALSYLETRPQVIAYFAVNAPPEKLQAGKDSIETKGYVDEVKAITKEEALTIFQEENKKDPLLIELVTADILPASLEVGAKSIDNLSQIKTDLEQIDGVEEVVYQKDVIDNVSRWTKTLRIFGLITTSVLMCITVLLIIVILSLRVGMKRSEISIMRLLGAGSWYIRGPFLFEGILYGVFGSIIGWLSSYILLLYLTPTLLAFFGQAQVLPFPVMVLGAMLGIGALIGTFLGIISSTFAVSRFVRTKG
jgi:cell division transport system permease protein